MGSVSGRRILVVENEPATALMLESMLRKLGCIVPGRTGSAADALAIIEMRRPGLDAATLSAAEHIEDIAAALEMRGIPFVITIRPDASASSAQFAGRPILSSPFRLEDLKTALASLDMSRPHHSR